MANERKSKKEKWRGKKKTLDANIERQEKRKKESEVTLVLFFVL
jgi:hypothetical protein